MTTKHYSPSSFGKEELIQGKFPDKGSAISDRKELTGLASLWNEAFGRKYKVLGGGSNSWPKVVCEQCNTRHAINPKGCVESSGQCRCPKSPVVKTNNVAAKFQTLGEARGAALGFLIRILRIPICAAKGLPPPNWAGPKLRKSSSSIPVYCKLSSGDWFCFTIKKSRTRGNGASFELVGLPESDAAVKAHGKDADVAREGSPESKAGESSETIAEAKLPPQKECALCCEKFLVTKSMNCGCGASYCQECIARIVLTRPNPPETNFIYRMAMLWSEADRDILCPYCRKPATHYIEESGNLLPIQPPVGWLYQRPFFSLKQMDEARPIFVEEVLPLLNERLECHNNILEEDSVISDCIEDLRIPGLSQTQRLHYRQIIKESKEQQEEFARRKGEIESEIPDYAKDSMASIQMPVRPDPPPAQAAANHQVVAGPNPNPHDIICIDID